jgi:hypothetical protein
MLRMNEIIVVQIIGTVVACPGGIKESWREIADWAKYKLTERFGNAVQVEYFDLFDPACPKFPEYAQIPVVLISGKVFSNGGKISVIAIRKYIESLMEGPRLGYR